MRTHKHDLVVAILVAWLGLAAAVHAAAFDWDGTAGNGLWSDVGNWGGAGPADDGVADDLRFQTGAAPNPNADGNGTWDIITSLTFDATTTAAFTITGDDLVMDATGTFTSNASTFRATWDLMRWGAWWKTGRIRSPLFRVRQASSTRCNCL